MEEFLPTLLQFQSADSEIIVADNASTDDSAEYIRQHFPSVKIIQLEKNFGFAGGYNQAIKQITSEYIVLINQDVAVTLNWLSPMVEMMEKDEQIAAIQPRIRSHLQRSHFEYAGAAGGWIDRFGYTFCRGRIFDAIEEDTNQYNKPAEIFWASGACMLTRKKIYETLGGLDEDFFAHMEEIDLCWRMKNHGYKIMYCPDSVVYHLGGGSLPQGDPFKTYLNYRNNLIMLTKNLPEDEMRRIVISRLLLDGISAIRSLLRGYPKDVSSIWRAHGEFRNGLSKWKSKRTGNEKNFFSLTGVYDGSIVKEFFFRKKRKFTELVPDD
jgi:GT2 family glycosyltransferase